MRYFLILFSLLILPSHIFSVGRLIEVCGIDGSGKSTFIQDMNHALTEQGRKVVVLKPLSGNPTAYKFLDEIDAFKNETENKKIHERIDRFKSDYFLLRFVNNKNMIERYLSEDYDVLCDRYLFSFKTYQECFNQSAVADEAILSDLPKEDITILVTVPIDVAIDRIKKRESSAPYENPIFLQRAQDIFLRDAGHYPHLVHLNGDEARESNIEKALSALEGT